MLKRTAVTGVATALAIGTTALAATPTGGATYKGTIDIPGPGANPKIALKVAADGSKLTAKFDCGDEGKYALKNVPIKNGKFSKKGEIASITANISGKFTSASKAKGELDTIICFINKAPFTARKK
jgi:hypothetical protein